MSSPECCSQGTVGHSAFPTSHGPGLQHRPLCGAEVTVVDLLPSSCGDPPTPHTAGPEQRWTCLTSLSPVEVILLSCGRASLWVHPSVQLQSAVVSVLGPLAVPLLPAGVWWGCCVLGRVWKSSSPPPFLKTALLYEIQMPHAWAVCAVLFKAWLRGSWAGYFSFVRGTV